MDWINIAVFAGIGAASGVVAALIVRQPKEKPLLYVVVFVLSMSILSGAEKAFVAPKLDASRHNREADAALSEIPFYKALASADPQTYSEIKQLTIAGLREGESSSATAARIAPVIARILPKYVSKASEDSVNHFIGLTTNHLEHMNATDPQACYTFLFPDANSIAASNGMDEATQKELMSAMGDVVQSAVQNPEPPPDKDRCDSLLAGVIEQLKTKAGNDVMALQAAGRTTDKPTRATICAVSVQLYKSVVELEAHDRASTTKCLLAK